MHQRLPTLDVDAVCLHCQLPRWMEDFIPTWLRRTPFLSGKPPGGSHERVIVEAPTTDVRQLPAYLDHLGFYPTRAYVRDKEVVLRVSVEYTRNGVCLEYPVEEINLLFWRFGWSIREYMHHYEGLGRILALSCHTPQEWRWQDAMYELAPRRGIFHPLRKCA